MNDMTAILVGVFGFALGAFTYHLIDENIRAAIQDLYAALEQQEPEQEPVAWATMYMGRPTQFFKNEDAEKKARAEIERLNREYPQDEQKRYAAPLYTHPPRREWVGSLTDEELDDCDQRSHGNTDWTKKRAFARAVAEKLKEKNNG
jgi:hypothetical protein